MRYPYMLARTIGLVFVCGVSLTIAAGAGGPAAAPGTVYQKVEGWPQIPPGMKLTVGESSTIGIIPDHGKVWMFLRSEPPIVQFDASGKVVKEFGKDMFARTHGFCQDSEGNLWAGDMGAERRASGEAGPAKGAQFHKFSPDGTLLMSLGKAGVVAEAPDTFVAPSACVVAPNGDIIIADGHIPRAAHAETGDRLVRYSKTGKFIRAYGKTGKGPGEFRGIHQLALDSQGRLFVADRSNSRIQIFDKNMNFVAEWRQFGRPSAMTILKDDTMVVTDWESGGPVPWPDWPGEPAGADASGRVRNPGFMSEILTKPFGPDTNTIRIGSAKDGSIRLRFQTPKSEAVAMDDSGAIYTGAEKYVPVVSKSN